VEGGGKCVVIDTSNAMVKETQTKDTKKHDASTFCRVTRKKQKRQPKHANSADAAGLHETNTSSHDQAPRRSKHGAAQYCGEALPPTAQNKSPQGAPVEFREQDPHRTYRISTYPRAPLPAAMSRRAASAASAATTSSPVTATALWSNMRGNGQVDGYTPSIKRQCLWVEAANQCGGGGRAPLRGSTKKVR